MARRGPASRAGVSAPADRRFRRPDVRPSRRGRIVHWIWRTVWYVIVVSVFLAAGFWVAMRLSVAPLFVVRQITVSGNTRLSAGEVEALVDGARGHGILRLNLDQYRERLMDSPWVASAAIRRVLPSTLEVRIVERVPMAMARLGNQLYLIDNTGVIIDEFGPQYHDFDLPVVDGLIQTPPGKPPATDAAGVQVTGRLLGDLLTAPDLRHRVSQIDVSSPHDVVVLLDTDTTLVHLGDAKFADRLRTFIDLAPALRERLADIDAVDMRFDERVYVRSRGRTIETKKKR